MNVLFKQFSKFLAPFVAAVALLGSGATMAAEKLPVLASFSILADVTRQIGGDRVEVSTIVGAGSDAHTYQLTPSDVRKIRAAKLLLVNGLGFEGAPMLRAMHDSKIPFADASKGLPARKALSDHDDHHEEHDDHDDHDDHDHHDHDKHDHDKHDDHDDHDHHAHHHHGNIDPHIWQDPVLMQGYVKNIAAALTRVDPAGASYYAQRLASYQNQLRNLNTWVEKQFQAIPASKRVVLSAHDAFGYFGHRYKVQFAFLQGIAGDSQTSAKKMARLIKFIQAKKVRAVFVENARDPRLVQQLSREAGVSVRQQKLYADALSTSEVANTYMKLVRHNTTAIAQALRK